MIARDRSGSPVRKLIIQIPSYNEESTLPAVLASLPREVEGFGAVETLVIDDGSADRTTEVAIASGADHVLTLNGHQGLARAFMFGLEEALRLQADVVVNTDADNQYQPRFIADLTAPILKGEADLVVGARPIDQMRHFSLAKRAFQRLGSFVVRHLSSTRVEDAPSGFRALSREAALRLNVFSHYTYTLETIIQAGLSNLRIANVPIDVNPPTRESRLMTGVGQYIRRSVTALLSAYLVYRPTRLFGALATVLLLPAAYLAVRYLYFMAIGEGVGHVQSVIAAGVLAICGVFMIAIGILAHLHSINRRILEDLRYLQRRIRHEHLRADEASRHEAASAADGRSLLP